MEKKQENAVKLASELNLPEDKVVAVLALLHEGATIPFIARYRKELSGSMDEVQVAAIRDRDLQLTELFKRRESILKSISEQGKLSPELETKILAAESLARLEDLYLPYKPKRVTRAAKARERGLQALAEQIMAQGSGEVLDWANTYINSEKEVPDAEHALAGARDIIAETMAEDAELRANLRQWMHQTAQVKSTVVKGKESEGVKYTDYFEWAEPLKQIPSHRLLAIRRAEKEGFVYMEMVVEEEEALHRLEKRFVTAHNPAADQVKAAAKDAFRRLLKPSLETEIRLESKKKADIEAVNVFVENVRQLLLASPLGQKRVLAIDPGFRTGCKVVLLDAQGNVLDNGTIYPHEPQRQHAEAEHKLDQWRTKYAIEAVAIGNGTAGRETESVLRSIGSFSGIPIVMVNESGASVYSASEVAREEFPDYDLTVRGAVSIGRRLMDPLAELVKIDPKSIGVGQYQHDVDQSLLQRSLDDTVVSCVNGVGVELNTASKQLLSYVSGIGPALAESIVEYRKSNGAFSSRAALLKVPRLGQKAFEQAAGFLRVRESENPLDRSAVHPERYGLVEKMAKDAGCAIEELMKNTQLRKAIPIRKYVSDEVGLPTLEDILKELEKPGLDPRAQFEVVQFAEGVNDIKDLRIGMSLTGIVTNMTKFGVFVDVGVHQDGLIHISALADRFIKDPSEVVKVGQKVQVTVLEVDIQRKRISLSMKTGAPSTAKPEAKKSANAAPANDWSDKLESLKSKFK